MFSHPPSRSSSPAVANRRVVVPLLLACPALALAGDLTQRQILPLLVLLVLLILATATMLPRLLTRHAGARLSWAGMLVALVARTGRHATLLQLVRHWPELMHVSGAAR